MLEALISHYHTIPHNNAQGTQVHSGEREGRGCRVQLSKRGKDERSGHAGGAHQWVGLLRPAESGPGGLSGKKNTASYLTTFAWLVFRCYTCLCDQPFSHQNSTICCDS